MHFVLATYGTTGDVQPLLPLARGLGARGHRATIAAPPKLGRGVQAAGLCFAALGPPVSDADERAVMAAGARMRSSADQALTNFRAMVPHVPAMFEDLSRICCDADAVLSVPWQLAGRMVSERQGVPYASIHFSPFAGLGPGARSFREQTEPIVNEARRRLGFAVLDDPVGRGGLSETLALFAVSRHFFPRPRLWPSQVHATGFLFDDDSGYRPEPRLVEFLRAGDPPVVVSLGSMMHDDPAAIGSLLVAAIDKTGRRAILQHGWSGIATGALPPQMLGVGFVPHGWLFPRAACVVHAGGAGTTAATLRAGVPSVVVPHWLDQPLWAQTLRDVGCAGAVVPYPELTSERLAEAIERTLGAPMPAVRRYADLIRAEAGAERAADLLISMAAARREADPP